jgi:hypothetical protein
MLCLLRTDIDFLLLLIVKTTDAGFDLHLWSCCAGFSDYLSSQATSAQVYSALTKLGTLGAISVNRRNGSRNGWAYSVTFHSAVGNPTTSMIYLDSKYVYSTGRDAGMKVYTVVDAATANVTSPQLLSNRTMVNRVLSFSQPIGTNYSASWISPSVLRVNVRNASEIPANLRGKLRAMLRVPLTGMQGKYYASGTQWSPTLT